MGSVIFKFSCFNEDCEAPLEAEITNIEAGYPGKLSGPWEDCYPAEGASWDTPAEIVCTSCGYVNDLDGMEDKIMELVTENMVDESGPCEYED
jgi:hypothetical protein